MKNILITGANQGIGYYIALQLLEQGENVYVLDLTTEKIDQKKEAYSQTLKTFVCDVGDEKAVTNCLNTWLKDCEYFDVLVSNAALCTFESFEKSPTELYHKVMQTNYFGALHLCRAVLPSMRQRKQGRVLIVSSGVGVTGFKDISPYASSKGALESLAKCLRLEYAPHNISLHIVHPPLTRTAAAKGLPVPEQMKADPEKVGRGIARKLFSRRFIICHSASQKFQTMLCYLMPLKFGDMMTMMTDRVAKRP